MHHSKLSIMYGKSLLQNNKLCLHVYVQVHTPRWDAVPALLSYINIYHETILE